MNPVKIDKITLAGMEFPIKAIDCMPDDMLVFISMSADKKKRDVVVIKGLDIHKKREEFKLTLSPLPCPTCGTQLYEKSQEGIQSFHCLNPSCTNNPPIYLRE